MLFGQLGNRRPHLAAALLAVQGLGRIVFAVHGFDMTGLPEMVHRHGRPASPPVGNGHVEGDAVQPGVKRAVAPERVQLEERLDQRLLDDVAGVLGMADHVEDRIVQPVLILQDQLSEGLRLPLEGQVDQLGVVAHSRLTISDAPRGVEVPAGVPEGGRRSFSSCNCPFCRHRWRKRPPSPSVRRPTPSSCRSEGRLSNPQGQACYDPRLAAAMVVRRQQFTLSL